MNKVYEAPTAESLQPIGNDAILTLSEESEIIEGPPVPFKIAIH